MANEKPVEGNPEGSAGAAEQSSSQASEQKGQPLPDDVMAVVNQIVESKLASFKKGIQKGTDKQIHTEINGSIERILELAGEGKNKAQIERELFLDSLAQGREGADAQIAADNGKNGNIPDVHKTIDEVLNLPENDSRVTNLKLLYGNDTAAYLKAGLELAAKLAGQTESTPGEQPIAQGRAPVVPEINPIEKIEDSRTLYRLAAEQMAKEKKPRRR